MTEVANSEKVKKARNDAVAANIRVLENFYSFLVSFALTQATYQLVTTLSAGAETAQVVGYMILYASFLLTIVPFYQGMNRFLYATHVVRPLEKPSSRSSPLLLDIYVFVIMSGLLFAMGRFLGNASTFFYIWSSLLALDVVWSLVVWQVQDSRKPLWALNNLKWLAAAWVYWAVVYVFSKTSCSSKDAVLWLQYGFVGFEVGRTFYDYKINWSFYFPPEYRGQ